MNRPAVLGAVLAALAVAPPVCHAEPKDTLAEEFQKTKASAEAGDVDADSRSGSSEHRR